MEFSIVDNGFVEVAHLGARLRFDVGQLKKSGLIVPGKDLFYEINRYIAGLEQHTQHQLFKLYEELRELRDHDIGVSFAAQQKETTGIVADIYELLNLDKLTAFAKSCNVTYPDGLKTRHSEAALNSTLNEKINYYKEDYDGLVALVIALRPMIPIWGEYISINKEATGTQYKEYRALKLISKSALNHYPAVDRLRLYINEWRVTGNARNNLADDIGVLDGISSDDLTDYILGLILVRRLSLCNVHASGKNDSIISSVYSYLKSKLTEAAKTFQTKKKYDDGVGRENGEEMSILEKYKISSKLTHGDREFLKEYARMPVNVAKEIDPTIDLFVLEECLQMNHSLPLSINNHQRLITQWVVNRAFPSQGVYELSRVEIINLISVVQAILIHWEFYEVALLMNAEIEGNSINIGAMGKVNVSDELLKELNQMYPYQKIVKRQHEKPNIAHDAINKLYVELSSKTLIINPPKTLEDASLHKAGSYVCPPNLIDKLAELIIRVNN